MQELGRKVSSIRPHQRLIEDEASEEEAKDPEAVVATPQLEEALRVLTDLVLIESKRQPATAQKKATRPES